MDEARARAIADRRTGVGCDQVILLEPSDVADVRMRIWNADGGEVEACGNATRCVVMLGARTIETKGGILAGDANGVDMGTPRFGWEEIPLAYAMDTAAMPVGWEDLQEPSAVNVGNPHVVFFVRDADAVDLARLGPLIETRPALSRARQRQRRLVRGRRDQAARLGAGRRADPGLRHRRLRDRRRGDPRPAARRPGRGSAPRRLADHRLAAGRDDPDERAGHPCLRRRAGRMSVEVITLGCRLNMAESEAMRALAGAQDDLVIVNSCAVTNEAVRQTRQAIRKAKRARPDARVVVTGCAAQVEPAAFAAMPEVSRVLGNREKFSPSSFQRKLESPFSLEGNEIPAFAGMTELGAGMTELAEIRVSDIMAVRETAPHLVTGFAERARAFVEVQNGCDHRCTFCIIPYGRGNSRSVPAGLVVERIKALADEGFREVVLTGVDVTSYGPDLPGAPTLGALIERILKHVPDLPRLRLSSLDCIELDERLFELATGEKRFMPHLHMSFQAGDDLVLKRMKRRHSRAEAVETVARLKARRPEIAIGADLIAGFPTESDEMAENSLRLVEECEIVMGHIFPYSPKRGTPAARMPQVPPQIVKQRARRLREACTRQRADWLEGLVGTRQRVLVERDGCGHAENFAPVQVRHSSESWNPTSSRQGDSSLRWNDGEIVEVRIAAVQQGTLIGVPA